MRTFTLALAFALAACGTPVDIDDAGPDVEDAGPEIGECNVRCLTKENGDRVINAVWPSDIGGDPVVDCCACQVMVDDTDPTSCGTTGAIYSKEQNFFCGVCSCGACDDVD